MERISASMSDLLNKKTLSAEILLAIDKNLKGEAARIYIDSYTIAQDLIVDFVEQLEAGLKKRFEN
jgi:recombinational DNA repair protein RecR